MRVKAIEVKEWVNDGSEVNILFKGEAKRIGILGNINEGKTIFQTLNEATVQSLGTVKLTVQAESQSHLVTFHIMVCLIFTMPFSAETGCTR
ncbi:hypothetical protein ACFX13_028775 [Malus domestica]